MKRTASFLFAAICLALVLPADSWRAPDEQVLTVTKKKTKLRNRKRLYARAVCELKEGDRLLLIAKEGPWRRASFEEKVGWVHESDVRVGTEVRLSGEGLREEYSAAETSAARKGFNRDVEREYESRNPDRVRLFALVDAIQSQVIDEDELVSFLRAGGLLEEEEGR